MTGASQYQRPAGSAVRARQPLLGLAAVGCGEAGGKESFGESRGRAGGWEPAFLECLAPGWVLPPQHFFNITYLFIWLHRVCAAVRGLSPVAASRGYRPGAACQPLIAVASLVAERWWAL